MAPRFGVSLVAALVAWPAAEVDARSTCGSLEAAENAVCAETVRWVARQGRYQAEAPKWFDEMAEITGVNYRAEATADDFQRLYFCAPPGGKWCGLPPCSCTKPPCDRCTAEAPKPFVRSGCEGGGEGIACRPPKTPFDYAGMAWPTTVIKGRGDMHVFAIGDWGGMDGSLKPIEQRPPLVQYAWGARPGPSVFPRTRWNAVHTKELCTHEEFIACYDSHGKGDKCPAGCGYVPEIDENPQQLVAAAMKERAKMYPPDYILNVGDNFYWGGIERTCGTPMDQIAYTTRHQFDQIYESIYFGPGLDGKPWFSVLGNHDWGGRQFVNGWDQQVAYTWASDRWVMPAPYYMTRVEKPEEDFSVDLFMLDSNVRDAFEPYNKNSGHNICSAKHNPSDADCSVAGGPASVATCPAYFRTLWAKQKAWLERMLRRSTATWQIMVTHFPCGEDGEGQRWYRKLHQEFGLDFMITGHRHDQEMWLPKMRKNRMGGLTCIVTGGGGGISSEATPDPRNTKDWYGEAQYGFYHLILTKQMMVVASINHDGEEVKWTTVHPKN